VGVRTFGLAKGVLRYIERLASHDAALRVLATLRVKLWDALVRLGPAATGRLRAGDLLARLIRDVDAQQDVLVRALVPAAAAAVAGLGAAIGLGVLLPSAGLTLAVGLFCAGLVAPVLTVRFARRAVARTAAARGAVAGAVVELLEARAELLAFGAAARRRQAVSELDARLTALHRRAATATGLGAGLSALAIGATCVGCTALGVTALAAGTLPGPFLAVLALTPLALVDVVAPLPDAGRQLATALPSTRRLATLASAPPSVSEPDQPRPAPPGHVLGARELSVRWPGAGLPAVSGVRLDVPAGGRLVLTGPSGSGKTTVLAAIMRTLDPCAGSVLIDGMDTRWMLGDDVRSRIAWCGPTTHLFDSSLRQNLLLACPGAQDRQLVDALRRAGLGGWLAGLPEGLATPVGQHGDAVSGGERQRIALARALLADRPALLLDEPTAHLDAATAARVSADLLTTTEGRTTIVVTHRPDELPGVPRVLLRPEQPS
jgi:ATP-binding cassette subfamily C protein CydCD